jgi:hypothetical protein
MFQTRRDGSRVDAPGVLTSKERLGSFNRASKSLCLFPIAQISAVSAAIIKFMALLLVSIVCMISSWAFLLSVGIAMPILTSQVAFWLKSGQWNAMPISTTLTRMGYTPHFDDGVTQTIAEWVLSCETGLLIVAAAATFGCAVWIFEAVRAPGTQELGQCRLS